MYGPQQENSKNTKFLGAVAAIVIGIALIITANIHDRPTHRSPILGISITIFGIVYLIILLFQSRKKRS
jgi:membrane associated rhomboid family serine protease